MAGGILDQARNRLPQRWQQQTLPSLYGVDNYSSLPGVQAHAQLATQAGHVLPTDYEGKRVELAQATVQSLCTIKGGTWDPATNSCIIPQVGNVNVGNLINSSSDRDIQRAIEVNHTGLYPGVTPGQSSVTVDDIKQIPTLGAGDVWGAEIFLPGSSLMGTDYTPWDPSVADYQNQAGLNLFTDIAGNVVPGLGGILDAVGVTGGESSVPGDVTVGINESGSTVSVGHGIGQVDPGLAQAAGYAIVSQSQAQEILKQPESLSDIVSSIKEGIFSAISGAEKDPITTVSGQSPFTTVDATNRPIDQGGIPSVGGNVSLTADQLAAQYAANPPAQTTSSASSLIENREGFRSEAYQDTLGNWTIGYGTTSINGRPVQQGDTISEPEARAEFNKDVSTAESAARANHPDFDSYSPELQSALTSQAYQLGEAGQAGFTQLNAALAAGDYDSAITQVQNSLWAQQTPTRSQDLVNAIIAEKNAKTSSSQASTILPSLNDVQENNLATAAGVSRAEWDQLTNYEKDQKLGGSEASELIDDIRREVNNPNSPHYNHYINRKARGEEWKSGNVGGPGGGHDGSSYTYSSPLAPQTSIRPPVRPTGVTTPSNTSSNDAVAKATQAVHSAAINSSADNWTKNVHAAQVAKVKAQQAADREAGNSSSSWWNRGGPVGNYAYGGATPESHPGEPMGTDKVPAWLTESEYVIDKDSAQGILSSSDKQELIKVIEQNDELLPAIEWINEWEPTNGPAGMAARESDMINEAAMREKFNKGGAVYRQLGGLASPFDQQRQAAQRTAQAQRSGALAAGGARGADIASANQAGLIGAAGLNNSSFTPQAGALSAIGEGVQGARQAEAEYQQELGRIAGAEADQAREDTLRAEEKAEKDKATAEEDRKNAEAIRNLGEQAAKAYGFVDAAAQAIYAKEKIITQWNNWYRAQSAIPLVNQGAGALDKAKADGIRIDFNRWQQENPDAASAYGVLERTVTQLTTGALEALGPGPKTMVSVSTSTDGNKRTLKQPKLTGYSNVLLHSLQPVSYTHLTLPTIYSV